jgi:hypothetical protein
MEGAPNGFGVRRIVFHEQDDDGFAVGHGTLVLSAERRFPAPWAVTVVPPVFSES